MARRSRRQDPEALRKKLVDLLKAFEQKLLENNLRDQVQSLIPANHMLRDMGSSLIKDDDAGSARERILAYLRKYPGIYISGDELMVVAGISEYARRIRELRVEMGWPILSGQAITDMINNETFPRAIQQEENLSADTYILVEDRQDRDAAFRWNVANEIRKSSLSVKDKILEFFRHNVGKKITGEELKYLAKDKSEWARRTRELRTEDGWPILTKNSGMPELAVGMYILEEDKQAEVHDRKIPDPVRIAVLERDHFKCRYCGWDPNNRNPGDRYRNFLELHHIQHHAVGGLNEERNLITLCNICHDEVHRSKIDEKHLKQLIPSLAEKKE